MSDVESSVRASSLSVLAWLDEAARPQVRGTVALVRGETPVLAFTYADRAVAEAVAASPEAVLALHEARSTAPAFSPMLVRARPRLVEDPTGDDFADGLLEQELRRFPPSRVYADSPLLRREHWWYLPRLLVHLEVEGAHPLAVRSESHDHLLVVAAAGRLEVLPARVAGSPGSPAVDVQGAAPGPGPAVVFGQDASFPDLERWSQWRYAGNWDGTALSVTHAPGRTGLSPAPTLLQRWRRQRDLERRCRRAIPRS